MKKLIFNSIFLSKYIIFIYICTAKSNINLKNNFIMKTNKTSKTSRQHVLQSLSIDIYQYQNGTLIHHHYHHHDGKLYTTDKFVEGGINKLNLSINSINLDADITSVTIYDHTNINYIK